MSRNETNCVRGLRTANLAVVAMLLGFAWVAAAQPPEDQSATEKLEVASSASHELPAQCPSRVIRAGKADEFATSDGVEPSAPSATLQSLIGPPFANFDEMGVNKDFVHTFRIPACKCLVGAKLEFRAKALSGQPKNDTVLLGFSTLALFPNWSAYLGGGNSGLPQLQPQAWMPPMQKTFVLDLAALPLAAHMGATTSLLSALQVNKYLDFYVQDDTAIDFVQLTVTMCDCCQTSGTAQICISKFWDKDKNGLSGPGEGPLAGWTFVVNDQAGGNVFTTVGTSQDGRVCLEVPAPATYAISEAPQAGWIQTTPANPAIPLVTVTPGGATVNLVFGNWRKKGWFPEDCFPICPN